MTSVYEYYPDQYPQISVSGYSLDNRSLAEAQLDYIRAKMDENGVKLDLILAELRAIRETQQRELDNAHG